jgi:pimeloyl-ACP methyl ester carboxylesterase
MRRSKKMILWILAATGTLFISGAVYQAIATSRDKRNYPPPGRMVSIGDRRLHLQISGEASARPTVILAAGMGSFSSNWYWVQEELSAETQVVSFDRAGLGWSDPAPAVQDAYDSAADLHAALENAEIGGPYIIVGHSYGGLVVRAFTDLYPDEVVGMVLVDGSHPDQWAHMPASRNGKLNALTTRITGWMARFGVVRLFDLGKTVYTGLPEQPAGEMRAMLNRSQNWATAAASLSVWPERTTPRINQAPSLGDMPLVVMGVTEQPYYSDVLTSLQADLLNLSTNSVLQIVQGATHEKLVGEQEYAGVVSAAIGQVLEAIETGKRLVHTEESVQ